MLLEIIMVFGLEFPTGRGLAAIRLGYGREVCAFLTKLRIEHMIANGTDSSFYLLRYVSNCFKRFQTTSVTIFGNISTTNYLIGMF